MQDNIKMYLKDIGCEDWRWIELAHNLVEWSALVIAIVVPER
jgi:hypothetical protein